LVRGSVNVKSDGSADVTVGGITGGVTFSGKLTSFDQNTLIITVESSGNANAGGEIQIKYNGRRLESIRGNNLVLDGQNVTLSF
jgi:small nuclear ribonucleoprotein (snRNP)-like protein